MPATLDTWQQKLESHFLQLALSRPVVEFPVFALEHDLTTDDIQEIRDLLRQRLRARLPLRQHWLVWVICAAELGYGYDGQEYWQSFEDQMPLWREQASRRSLRSWFSQFQKAYGGIIPEGPWAEHFSVIAWPITHAILPRDLQGQFARLLYTLRFEIASLPRSSEIIGEFIRSHSPSGSSRFENLLEQTGLTGRLVLALAQQESSQEAPVIHPPTLARITSDLEQRQSSRDWLRDARAVLRNARIQAGTSFGSGARQPVSTGQPAQHLPRTVGLLARQSAAGEWTLGVAYPDFQMILGACGMAPEALSAADVILADQPSSSMPARALLALSRRTRAIDSLSDVVGKPLCTLKPALEPLSSYLNELRLEGSRSWLLRVQGDGSARQVRGHHVRAGETYLYLSQAPVPDNIVQDLGLRLQTSRTKGISIYHLDVPDQLGRWYLEALARLNIGHALRTRVEAFGLVPRLADTEDATIWLPGEPIILRLSSDTEVSTYTIGVDGADWTTIQASTETETLVSIGALPLGQHVVEVRATAEGAVSARRDEQLQAERISIEVRAPGNWHEAARQQSGFRLSLTPPDARLPDLVSGNASLDIIGPSNRIAIVSADCYDINGHQADHIALGNVALPPKPRSVHQLVARLGIEPASERIETAPRVDISVQIEELGLQSVSLRQRVEPLRWKMQTGAGNAIARLVDEAGAEEEVIVDRYDIRAPGTRIPASRDECQDGLAIGPPGALLSAKFKGRRYSALISVPGKITSLSDLGIEIRLGSRQDNIHAVRALIPLYRLWAQARTLGPLAPLRKSMVIDAIDRQIASIACGRDWAWRLLAIRSSSDPALERIQREVSQLRGFGYRMRVTNWVSPEGQISPFEAFRRSVSNYKITDDPALVTIAFQLAFEPGAVRLDLPGSRGSSDILNRLSQTQALMRGAYLARTMRGMQMRELLSSEAA